MMKNLTDFLKKQYEIYDIDDMVFDKICDEAIKSFIPNDTIDIEYQCKFRIKSYLDNYIMEEIQKGNEDYKMILSLTNIYLVKKYINMRNVDIDIDYINTKYKDVEQAKRLERYYDEISDIIVNNLQQEYDKDKTFEKQYIKELSKKFNK